MSKAEATRPPSETAVDNDVILKAVSYGLSSTFWPADVRAHLGVLGAARYVVSGAIERAALSKDRAEAQAELKSLLADVVVLEPTDDEVHRAADIELEAQQASVALDTGESQLCSIVTTRAMGELQTGDKRAIRGIEQLLDRVDGLRSLCGKVRCLEQLVLGCLGDAAAFDPVAKAVCAEPAVDKTLRICFGCDSGSAASLESVLEGLDSYISALRTEAPQVLVS